MNSCADVCIKVVENMSLLANVNNRRGLLLSGGQMPSTVKGQSNIVDFRTAEGEQSIDMIRTNPYPNPNPNH